MLHWDAGLILFDLEDMVDVITPIECLVDLQKFMSCRAIFFSLLSIATYLYAKWKASWL